jgi:hypothetical protein
VVVPVLTVVLFMDAQAVIVVGAFELGNSNGKLLVACPAADGDGAGAENEVALGVGVAVVV